MTTRQYISVPTSIWRDQGFSMLTWRAQRMYLLLASQRQLSQAACVSFTARRWANLASTGSTDDVYADIAELEQFGFAWTDLDTGELLLRRLLPPAGHKQLQGALQATFEISSVRLRQIAIDGLVTMGHDGRRVAAGTRGDGFAKMRMAVHLRDGFTCQHCNWRPDVPEGYDGRYALGKVYLDEATPAYRVRILELDHVYPDSLGGPFEMENLQTLCSSCNARKGAKVS